ncbi:MAG: L-threonylcarbamoyladenylate synthase [candidate division KSB1 bacterium]|nr:L-threonylcarbamoyladenylate synthase [candidate division KSB1 bacterium]
MSRIIKINPHHPEEETLHLASEVIRQDGVIGYPTETVYGLGANIFSAQAVNRIFEIKGRDRTKPIIVIVASLEQVWELVTEIPEIGLELIKAFWPGPLTIVFKASEKVPESLSGGSKTIALRIPNSKICLELLKWCQVPLTSTSANLAGGPNPLTATAVWDALASRIDLLLDGGPAPSKLPSTVIDVTQVEPQIRRAGAIEIEKIERIIRP